MNAPRLVGETKSQGWEIGVRRTLPISAGKAWRLLLEALGLAGIEEPDAPVDKKGLTFKTEAGTEVEIRSYEPSNLLRMKWQPRGWDVNSTLQIRVAPAKTGSTLSVHHEWLQNAEQREAMRAYWTALLDELRMRVGASE
ncbi:MAG TPA: SRPBCC domain-containing protein [Phototrophicaceae bacterium]|nr:SRPBCC domain-containing protein [Phototrophicaceae bacterium]